MAQQTAAEWLEQQLKSTYDNEGKLPLAYTLDLVKQAKQMEKEQHSNTWTDARTHYNGDDYIGKEISFEQYYNETYGDQGK